MQVFAGAAAIFLLIINIRNACLLFVCLVNIIFGANSNSVKMSFALANCIVQCEHWKSDTSPQVYLI